MHTLETFPIHRLLFPESGLGFAQAHATEEVLGALESAIAGQRTLLPVSEENEAVLRASQRAGHDIDPSVALVVATSGSTGTPKGAMLSPANVISSADATHQYLGGEGQWLLAMPPNHIAGLQVLIRSMVAGFTPAVLNVAQGFQVHAFAEAAGNLEGRRYTSLTPLQLLKAMDSLEGIDALRSFDAILVGGAPLLVDDQRAASELGITLISTYGSSETSGGCVYNGKPIPGAKVRLRGERIILGGPMVARGYRNMPDHEAFAEPGWFASSDTGVVEDGVLRITGRMDTIIDSGGLKIHPEVLEHRLANVPGVRAVCVVGIPDRRLGQAIVCAFEGDASPEDLIEALDDLPRWQLPKRMLKLDALPLIGVGKVDRQAIAALFNSDKTRQ
ncbi:o-succinylbenzoate--CoA ligase [Corynebacterium pseudopelargi]|uniref:2-succinylbenzoate--CoA ligase n=1 Tax=Corynebacterium pseudopelargi TaxID=2080757 RepID=A0A3G6IWD6_9CORY|nr:o-succinylbenzoate--CoA ligase [Corynebacterium pseudopelargi]AZA10099.1 2-succinylbenzoate--CoA ligase [Corynebacterium pseudopelargi]